MYSLVCWSTFVFEGYSQMFPNLFAIKILPYAFLSVTRNANVFRLRLLLTHVRQHTNRAFYSAGYSVLKTGPGLKRVFIRGSFVSDSRLKKKKRCTY